MRIQFNTKKKRELLIKTKHGRAFTFKLFEANHLFFFVYSLFAGEAISKQEKIIMMQYYFVNAVFGQSTAHVRRRRMFDANFFLRGPDSSEQNNCPEDVTQRPVDFLVMVDKSGGLKKKQFRHLLRSIRFLVEKAIPSISMDTTRMALMTFSTSPTVEFYLKTCETSECILEKLNKPVYTGGVTRMATALTKAGEVFTEENGMRSCSRRVILLLTDGSGHGRHESSTPKIEASILKGTHGVEIFAIGITRLISEVELMEVVSAPSLTHLYYMETVKQTRRIFKRLSQARSNDEFSSSWTVNFFWYSHLRNTKFPCPNLFISFWSFFHYPFSRVPFHEHRYGKENQLALSRAFTEPVNIQLMSSQANHSESETLLKPAYPYFYSQCNSSAANRCASYYCFSHDSLDAVQIAFYYQISSGRKLNNFFLNKFDCDLCSLFEEALHSGLLVNSCERMAPQNEMKHLLLEQKTPANQEQGRGEQKFSMFKNSTDRYRSIKFEMWNFVVKHRTANSKRGCTGM